MWERTEIKNLEGKGERQDLPLYMLEQAGTPDEATSLYSTNSKTKPKNHLVLWIPWH